MSELSKTFFLVPSTCNDFPANADFVSNEYIIERAENDVATNMSNNEKNIVISTIHIRSAASNTSVLEQNYQKDNVVSILQR